MKADVYERITGQIVTELEKGVRPWFKWLLYEGGTKYERTPGRCAHTYVFAWNGFSDDEADHRNPAQWVFYVVPGVSAPRWAKNDLTIKDRKAGRARSNYRSRGRGYEGGSIAPIAMRGFRLTAGSAAEYCPYFGLSALGCTWRLLPQKKRNRRAFSTANFALGISLTETISTFNLATLRREISIKLNEGILLGRCR